MDPRFTTAVEAHQSEYAIKVEKEYGKKLNQLNGHLDLALGREEEKAIAAGDLDLVTAIRAERKALDEKSAVPSEGDEVAPAVVKRFRVAWRKQKADLEKARQAAATATTAAFSRQLEQLEKTLTQERKIEQALAVRDYREKQLPSNAVAPVAHAVDGAWETIFDGSSLSGWRTEQPKAFSLIDGGLEARKAGKSAKSGYLYYVGKDGEPDIFENFEVRMQLRVKDVGSANSGIFYHVPPETANSPVGGGIEINIANQNTLMNQTGSVFGIKAVQKPLLNQKQKFEMLIRVTSSELVVTTRGKEVIRIDPSSEKKPAYRSGGGAIVLQANSHEAAYVFERIEVRRLD